MFRAQKEWIPFLKLLFYFVLFYIIANVIKNPVHCYFDSKTGTNGTNVQNSISALYPDPIGKNPSLGSGLLDLSFWFLEDKCRLLCFPGKGTKSLGEKTPVRLLKAEM